MRYFAGAVVFLTLVGDVVAGTVVVPVTPKPTPGPISSQDQQFVNFAWNVNTSEIKLGHLAAKRTSNHLVQEFAVRMIKDHTALEHQLVDLVNQYGAALPTTLNKQQQELYDRLNEANGSDFDREYMNAMILGHETAVARFESEASDMVQTAVDKWAAQALPILKQHLGLAMRTGKEVGAPAVHHKAPVPAAATTQP